jgi:hypothetical protein
MHNCLPPLNVYVHTPRCLQFLHREVGGAYEEPEFCDVDSESTVGAESSSEELSRGSREEEIDSERFKPSEEEECDDQEDLSYLEED